MKGVNGRNRVGANCTPAYVESRYHFEMWTRHFTQPTRFTDNYDVTVSRWQRRIDRAQELAVQHSFAAEILGFYIHVARFQEDLHQTLSASFSRQSPSALISPELTLDELEKLCSGFSSFLSMVEARAPNSLAEVSHGVQGRGQGFWSELLKESW